MIDIESHLSKIEQVENATFQVMRQVLIEITPSVTDFVRSMLVKKFQAAGMKSDTGKMLDAIKGTSVRINLFGKRPNITYSLPAGIAPYEGSKTPFYQVFMAQSYGAVRGATGTKAKDKRAIKKLALRRKSGIVRQYQLTGSTLRKADESGSINSGSIVVTKPKKFWQMTNSEEAQVRELVSTEIDTALKRRK